MKKRSSFRPQSKHTSVSQRPEVNTRELPPRVRKNESGYQLMCPFCIPSHPIVPGQDAACGTALKVTAIQTIIPVRTVRDHNLRCLKCHETGRSPMVRSGNGFVHLDDCVPGTKVLTEPPPNSKLAERIFNLKDGWLKKWLEKRWGTARCVKEIDVEGNETGKILSYFFQKV